jgi:SAM-dependent methyltransferase
MKRRYSSEFYRKQSPGSLSSAREVVPIILELIQPLSVIDFGCGIGTWLSVFEENGVKDIVGVDGDYVDMRTLLIPTEGFIPLDIASPIRMDRTFDLVISLEVAEHLPHKLANTFVENLTRLGSLVLFSAAIPFQRGTGHVNEQWPDYWAEVFATNGYVAVDCFRRRIWQNPEVEPFYAQNLLMFVRGEELAKHPGLILESERMGQLSIVHPTIYTGNILTSDSLRLEIRRLISALKHSTLRITR